MTETAANSLSILDDVPQGTFLVSSDYILQFWNRTMERWTGLTRSTLVGCALGDHFPHLTRPPYRSRLEAVLGGGPPTIFSAQLHGQLIPVPAERGGPRKQHTIVHAVRLPDDHLAALFSLEDVTELTNRALVYAELSQRLQAELAQRRHAEAEQQKLIAQLEAKNAELERFAYTASHELKSPLVTIRGFADVLEEGVAEGDAEAVQAALAYINDATEKMRDRLDDLLQLARVGQVVGPPVTVPLDDLVQEAIGLVSKRIETSGARVQVTPGLPAVRGDRLRLLEVFENLLDNAAKFMGPQPAPLIKVWACTHEHEVAVYIGDNGIGIPEPYQTRVFELFEKLHKSADGTGVGLAVVKRIVELHGGRIAVESAGHTQGSTFSFTLPRDPLAAQPERGQ